MLSVVVPCFNESEALGPLAARLRPVLDSLDEGYEVVFVDDGSHDDTVGKIRKLAAQWPQVRLCELVRNSGHQAAITAGINAANGEYIVTMDADLQDPPEAIPEMLALAKSDGLDVVYARRLSRARDSAFKRSTARLYYFAIRRITGIELLQDAGDFRLISRHVADALEMLPERRRVYRLLIPWLGFPSGSVGHERDSRVAGKSKYTMHKMVSLGFDSLASFSSTPLHLATLAGLVVGLVSLAGAGFVVIGGILGQTVPGWASILASVFFLGSVQLICLGVLGSYVGRVYEEVRHRPLYVVKGPGPDADESSSDIL